MFARFIVKSVTMAAFLTLLFTVITGLKELVPVAGALVTIFAAACVALYVLRQLFMRAARRRN